MLVCMRRKTTSHAAPFKRLPGFDYVTQAFRPYTSELGMRVQFLSAKLGDIQRCPRAPRMLRPRSLRPKVVTHGVVEVAAPLAMSRAATPTPWRRGQGAMLATRLDAQISGECTPRLRSLLSARPPPEQTGRGGRAYFARHADPRGKMFVCDVSGQPNHHVAAAQHITSLAFVVLYNRWGSGTLAACSTPRRRKLIVDSSRRFEVLGLAVEVAPGVVAGGMEFEEKGCNHLKVWRGLREWRFRIGQTGSGPGTLASLPRFDPEAPLFRQIRPEPCALISRSEFAIHRS